MGNLCGGPRQPHDFYKPSKDYKPPAGVKKAHNEITKIFNNNKDWDIDHVLKKMEGRHERVHIQATVDHLFNLARTRLPDQE